MADDTRYWRIRKYLPERFGQRCRVVVYGRRLNSCLVEFEDGSRYITIRYFVSPTPPKARTNYEFAVMALALMAIDDPKRDEQHAYVQQQFDALIAAVRAEREPVDGVAGVSRPAVDAAERTPSTR